MTPSKDISSSRKDTGMTLEGFLTGRNVSEGVEIWQDECMDAMEAFLRFMVLA